MVEGGFRVSEGMEEEEYDVCIFERSVVGELEIERGDADVIEREGDELCVYSTEGDERNE